jgi:hypothetical protein
VSDHHPIIVEVKTDQNMDVESVTIPISDKVDGKKQDSRIN